MKINWIRVSYDLQYVMLNLFINRVPCWTIRKLVYQKCGLRIGKDARIGIGTTVICPKGIKIGDRSVVNENCVLDGRGGLAIGHDTSVSMFSKMLSASHKPDSSKFEYYTKRTVIGSNVWIGTSAVILDGSKIADCAVVGANATVKGVVKRKSVVVGNPAREIRERRLDKSYRLDYKAYFR